MRGQRSSLLTLQRIQTCCPTTAQVYCSHKFQNCGFLQRPCLQCLCGVTCPWPETAALISFATSLKNANQLIQKVNLVQPTRLLRSISGVSISNYIQYQCAIISYYTKCSVFCKTVQNTVEHSYVHVYIYLYLAATFVQNYFQKKKDTTQLLKINDYKNQKILLLVIGIITIIVNHKVSIMTVKLNSM